MEKLLSREAERNERAGDRLNIGEKLALIGLIEEGARQGAPDSPLASDLFEGLWGLVARTVSGSRIDHLSPADADHIFQVLEISSESGENLGRLNMLYINKPLPCYYLVYVEVAPPFRNKGLGNRILHYFGNFLAEKSAVGLLDNIIPKDDPTCSIYFKHGWRPMEDITGSSGLAGTDNFMVFIPPRLMKKDLKDAVLKMVYHLKRRRAAIEMRDNEVMVRQTIAEFRDLYAALAAYFREDLASGNQTPLMRFMFTRFVTKLIAFRRRIGQLLGYTGGESLEQIHLEEAVLDLPVQSYPPRELTGETSFFFGDGALKEALPADFWETPASFIEALPNYRRPSYANWLKDRNPDLPLKIRELLDLGFDPTRLKEIRIGNREYIFERLQARQLPELEEKKELLARLSANLKGARVRNAAMSVNPPLLAVGNRGSLYALRLKVPGIHWEEAEAELHLQPALAEMNRSLNLDRIIRSTVKAAIEWTGGTLGLPQAEVSDRLTYFVSWDLDSGRPKMIADFSGTFLETVWAA